MKYPLFGSIWNQLCDVTYFISFFLFLERKLIIYIIYITFFVNMQCLMDMIYSLYQFNYVLILCICLWAPPLVYNYFLLCLITLIQKAVIISMSFIFGNCFHLIMELLFLHIQRFSNWQWLICYQWLIIGWSNSFHSMECSLSIWAIEQYQWGSKVYFLIW